MPIWEKAQDIFRVFSVYFPGLSWPKPGWYHEVGDFNVLVAVCHYNNTLSRSSESNNTST